MNYKYIMKYECYDIYETTVVVGNPYGIGGL